MPGTSPTLPLTPQDITKARKNAIVFLLHKNILR